MTDGLKDVHRQAIIATIAANDRVERAVLFGSRATGTNTVSSDVDIALFGNRLTLTDQARLAAALDELPMAQRVDLLLYETIDNPALREQIGRHGVEWYRRPQGTTNARIVEGAGGGTMPPDTMPQSPQVCGSLRRAGVWRESTWGEDIALEYGKALRGHDKSAGTVRVFGSNGPIGWTDEPLAIGPGVILGRKGAYRGVEYSPDPFFVIDTAYYVVSKTDHDMRWLYYAVKHYKLGEIDDGSPIPSTTRAAVYSQKFMVPPLPEQRTIAHILGTLDDKIEMNRRMNATLEAMARAIFKDWFVDFGPTRAKMTGREPYVTPEIWGLFPDKFNDEGEPEAWEARPLNDFFEIVGGGTPKTSIAEYWGGEIPWFSVADTPSKGSIFVVDTEKNITGRGLAESSVRLIPPGTTIISARGTVGNLAMAAAEMTFNQSCYALRRTDETGNCLVYLAAQHMVSQLQTMAHGSVFSTIVRQTFKAVTLSMPPPSILAEFEQQVAPFFQRIRANVYESRTLAQTRDLLLPRLMSGEIRVGDAEKAMAAVT